MKRFFLTWGLFFSLTCLFASAQNLAYEIYVFNRPLPAKIISKQGAIYVPAHALAQALALKVEKKGESLCIGDIYQETVKGKLVLNGQPFSQVLITKEGELYVALKDFVIASGNRIIENNETKIIDIMKGAPKQVSQVSSNSTTNLKITSVKHAVNNQSDFDKINQQYSGFYTSSPDVVQYMNEMHILDEQMIKSYDQLYSKTANAITMNDPREKMKELGIIMQEYAVFLNKFQGTLAKINPPKEFKHSHTVLRKIIDSYYPELGSINIEGSILLKNIHRISSEQQADEVINRLGYLEERVHKLTAQVKYDITSYYKALKYDLENLPKSRGPVQT